MANYYYIKTGGTATGDAGRVATTPSTGSFATKGASAYYATITAALAASTAPAAGDYMIISDAHAENSGSNINVNGVSGLTATGLLYVSVDDSNLDQYSAGASKQVEATGGTADVSFCNGTGDRASFKGLWFESDDNNQILGQQASCYFEDCTFRVSASGDICLFIVSGDGIHADLVNCTLQCDHASADPITLHDGGSLNMFGGAIASTASLAAAITGGGSNGGFTANLTGVNLESVTGAGSYLVANVGNSTAEDTITVKFSRCKLSASLVGFVEESLYGPGKQVEVYNCSGTSSAAEYQFYKNADQHVAQDSTSTYRNESTAFTDGSTKASIEVITAAHANRLQPFYFEFLARYAELSSASTDTLRVFLTSDSSLTDNDVWCELIYPDGTNKHTANFLSTVNSDPLATGTALTTDSTSTYTSGKTNKYQIDIDTSGDVGADCAPILRVYVGKASTTVYFDTTVDVVA